MKLGELGTITENGNSEYRPWENPLLQQGVLGMNPMGWGANPMNPETFATPAAAAAIGKVVGGEVVDDPMAARFKVTSRMLAIRLGGVTVNAGGLCSVMGNDCGFASIRAKSWEICSMLGLAFDAKMAEKIWDAIFGAE